MARDFDGSDDNLLVDVAAVTAYPFTISCWGNSDSTAGNAVLGCIVDKDVGTVRHLLYHEGADNTIICQSSVGGSTALAETSTNIDTGVWYHACGVFAAAQDHRAFLNGGGKISDIINSAAIGAVDRTAVGRSMDSTASAPYNGKLAEFAIWDVALTDAEVLILAAGFSPLLVRPQSLVHYVPLIGRTSPEIEIIRGNDMAITGATAFPHPPMIWPTQSLSGFAAAPAVALPVGKRRVIRIGEMLKYAPAPILAGGLGLAWVINRRNKLLREGRN